MSDSALPGVDNETALLVWAVQSCGPAPRLRPLDTDRLLHLCNVHKMTHRLFARLEAEQPSSVPVSVLTALRLRRLHIERQSRAQIECARDIDKIARRATGKPALWIKGFSVYALTGKREHRHPSGDLDLLCADPAALFDALVEAGYTGYVHERAAGEVGHEWATLESNGVSIEIHGHYPSNVYPDGLKRNDPAFGVCTGHRIQPCTNFRVHQIGYDDLSPYSCLASGGDTAGLTVLSPAACAFLLCLHECRSFIVPVFWNAHTFLLSTIADVFDLACRPDFNRRAFAALCRTHHANDAARFIGTLLAAYFGRDPLTGQKADAPFVFPRTLTSFGGWLAFDTPYSLLSPLDENRFWSALGLNEVCVPAYKKSAVYTLGGDAPTLLSAITQNPEKARLPFRFTLSQEDRVVYLDTVFPTPLSARDAYDVQSVAFTGQYQTLRWVYVGKQGGDVRYGGDPLLRGVVVESAGRGYRMRLPLFTLRDRRSDLRRLLVFKKNANPLTIVPVRFLCEAA